MRLITTLSRAAGLVLCVVAFSGTALADPGNGNGNGPEATPPGQEKKAETPAATPPVTPAATPAPQASVGQEKKAEQQEAKVEKQAAAKPAKAPKPAKAEKAKVEKQEPKAAKPAKSSGSYKNTSSGTDLKKGMSHKHTICHATGSASNPYVRITPSVSGVFHGHLDHQGDRDIVPPFTYKGVQYSQNWDAAGQAIFTAGCELPAAAQAPATTSTPPATQQTGNCPQTVTTTEQVLVGVKHFTGAVKDGQRKFVVISPSLKSAHLNGKHPDDRAIDETRTVTRTASGESCATVTSTSMTSTSNTSSTAGTQSSSQSSSQSSPSTAVAGAASSPEQSAGGVAGAVSPTLKKAKSKPAGGVLGAIASAPEAIAKTATGTLPFTGFPLWMAALIGSALLAAGLTLRRSA